MPVDVPATASAPSWRPALVAPAGAGLSERPEPRRPHLAGGEAGGVVAELLALAGEESRVQREAGLRRLLARTCVDSLIDRHIPEAARLLGTRWSCDEAGFVEVTLAAGRLQAMVRDLAQSRRADDAAASDAPTVLLVLPEGEQHSLGILVASVQARRAGISAQLALGRPARDVLALLRRTRFDLVAISVGCSRTLDAAADLITCIRSGVPDAPPISVGGAGVPCESDINLRAGADHVCSDIVEAVRRCGLSSRVESAQRRRARAG